MNFNVGDKVQFRPWKELKHTPYVRNWMEKYSGRATTITGKEKRGMIYYYSIDMIIEELRSGHKFYWMNDKFYWMNEDFIFDNNVNDKIYNTLRGIK